MNFFFEEDGALPENHPAYKMRHKVDDEALAAVVGGHILHVIAPRQVGKTSLLKQIRARLVEDGWRCALVDLSDLMDLSMTRWYAELGELLAEELTPGYSPGLTNQVDMKRYLTRVALSWKQAQPRIAIFFDEVESAVKVRDAGGAPCSDSFFLTLRDLYQQRDRRNGVLSIALAGAVSPGHLVKDQSISPFNVGHKLDMDDFTTDEARILTDHLESLQTGVEEAVHGVIYEWTHGHPYLTHRLCYELEKMALAQPHTEITVDTVNQIVKSTFLQPKNPLLLDSNIAHISKILDSLPEPARSIAERLRRGETISRRGVDSIAFLDIYLTGAVKVRDERIVIRNRIYEEIFVTQARSQSSTEVGERHVQFSAQRDLQDVPRTGEPFLNERERQRVIEILTYTIGDMSPYEFRNILGACKISTRFASNFNFNQGPHQVVNELVWRLEGAGVLDSARQYHAFGALLAHLSQQEIVGYDAALEFIILIFKYHLIVDGNKINELSSHFQIPLPPLADPAPFKKETLLAHLPERMRRELPPAVVHKRLEGLYNRGIRHYNDPSFFILGTRAIHSVCRIEFDGRGEGTGFLVAPDLVLTNYHVFVPSGSSSDIVDRARRCELRFGAKRNEEGGVESGWVFRLRQDWLVESSHTNDLDFLLLRLAQPAAGGPITPVEMAPGDMLVGEDIFVNIIHHPLGGAMEVSLRCNQVLKVEDQRIYYLADTEQGSSGSPVFNDRWKVVGLHRAGGERDTSGNLIEANAGIPIGPILARISHHLPRN